MAHPLWCERALGAALFTLLALGAPTASATTIEYNVALGASDFSRVDTVRRGLDDRLKAALPTLVASGGDTIDVHISLSPGLAFQIEAGVNSAQMGVGISISQDHWSDGGPDSLVTFAGAINIAGFSVSVARYRSTAQGEPPPASAPAVGEVWDQGGLLTNPGQVASFSGLSYSFTVDPMFGTGASFAMSTFYIEARKSSAAAGEHLVTIGGASGVPEPMAAWLAPIALALLGARRRRS